MRADGGDVATSGKHRPRWDSEAAQDERREVSQQMGHQMNSSVGSVVVSRRAPLPGDARSPALARALARDVVEECGLSSLSDEVALLTTELATNAVVHAGTAMHIEVVGDAAGITVRVTDGSRAVLGPSLPPPMLAEGGRGLHLVDSLASEWGVAYGRSGKSVWFRLDVDDPVVTRAGSGPPATVTPEPVVEPPEPAEPRWGLRREVGIGLGRKIRGRRNGAVGAGGVVVKANEPAVPPKQVRRPVAGRSAAVVPAAEAAGWLTYLTDRVVHELDSTELAQEILYRLGEVTGASFGVLWVDEGSGVRALASVGITEDPIDPPVRLWPDDPPRPRNADLLPPTQALADAGAGVALSVALPSSPPIRGRLELGMPAGSLFRSADAVFALLAAERLAVSLDAARLRDTEQNRRGDLAFLADASELLASSLDVDLTLALVAQLCVPRLGEWCVIHTLDDAGDPELVVAVHNDERGVPELEDAFLAPDGAVLRERIRAATVTHAATPLTGPLSGLVLPLTARREVVGTMSIGDPPGRRHTSEEVAIAVDLARRAALSVDNARLYSERDSVAEALQSALLPASLPVADGLEFAAQYRPAGASNEVGGDFYDVLPLGDERWLLAIGDVCGKGPQAASVTGMVRDVLRTLAREGRDLPYALSALNRALVEEASLVREGNGPIDGQTVFCTVAAAFAERREGGLRVRLCLAGHPSPIAVRARGGAEPVGVGGMAAGLTDHIEVEEVSVDLGPGDALVFYTDGVTERRRGDAQFGEEGVLEVLSRSSGLSAADIAAGLRTAATDFGDGPLRDDLAILALRAAP
ncbi:SpoIIE family protein phosphatase [Cryptosporangium arvum]|uniref:Stage II sporulation protein E (SpoIIE) n=1 Tax=Cryptosporangium arvum DSM 44712 TaxID=927661 RepID=A0A010YIT0_9ACTN|nr:SpoIIE family protein phosphatase [Cryptosporangium arvum]EXG80150.1 Stage II sporulation protein E (SpoIIE) [Cryptosporangium arvum DSM 44712]